HPEVDENIVVYLKNSLLGVDGAYEIKEAHWNYRLGRTTLMCGQYVHTEYEHQKQIKEKIHQLESMNNTVKVIKEFRSAEEVIAIADVVTVKDTPDEALAETVTIDDTVTAVQMFSGYGVAKYNKASGYGV